MQTEKTQSPCLNRAELKRHCKESNLKDSPMKSHYNQSTERQLGRPGQMELVAKASLLQNKNMHIAASPIIPQCKHNKDGR